MNIKDFTTTRAVVYTAVIGAVYWTLSMLVAPIAYGPLQLRVATFLYPLALFNPLYVLGFGMGTFLTNMTSPFGIWDFAVMPFVAIGAGLIAWTLKKYPLFAVILQSLVIALGVSVFPLGIGGSIPFKFTFLPVLASQLLINVTAWIVLWRPFYGKGIFEGR